jgi:hypothetical protein
VSAASLQIFLGKVVAKAIQKHLEVGRSDLRLIDVSEFDIPSMLREVARLCDPLPKIAIAGEDVRDLVRASGYPRNLITGSLSTAASWRNDSDAVHPRIVIGSSDDEKLGTFHRYTPITDHFLFQSICDQAINDSGVCPNDVLRLWWRVLGSATISRVVSVQRVARYFLAISESGDDAPVASREALYLLGLFRSELFFDGATHATLVRNFRTNQSLVERVESLSGRDRDRLSAAIDNATAAELPARRQAIEAVLRYHRSGSDADRAAIVYENVVDLFRSSSRGVGPARTARNVGAERAGAHAALAMDDDSLKELGSRMRESIDACVESEEGVATFEAMGSSGNVTVRVPIALLNLLNRAVTPTVFGGVFEAPAVATLDLAIADAGACGFRAFDVSDPHGFQALLDGAVAAGLIESEVRECWDRFVSLRGALCQHAHVLAVSPLLALLSDADLLELGADYIAAYESLSAAIKDRFETVFHSSQMGARRLCVQLLLLDTIVIAVKGGTYALLSPLNPMHLWKYVRLAAQVLADRQGLTDNEKYILSESCEQLPNFLSALFIPEGLLGAGGALVMPESHQVGTLPCFQQECLQYAGSEGQDRLQAILEKFLVLYRHAKKTIRMVLIDPPDLPAFLESLAKSVADGESDAEGIAIQVYRTLDRGVSLGTDEQQLETIAEVFGADNFPHCAIEITHDKLSYRDVIGRISGDPVHLIAVFDPSSQQVGRVSSTARGHLHPLAVPQAFTYDVMTDDFDTSPAPTGDLFHTYHSLQSYANNTMSDTHFSVSTSLGPGFPSFSDWLTCCTWLFVADRSLRHLRKQGGSIIYFDAGSKRDVIVVSDSMTKFEREFSYHLTQANLAPTEEAVRELIASCSELIGDGLLGLIRSSGDQ